MICAPAQADAVAAVLAVGRAHAPDNPTVVVAFLDLAEQSEVDESATESLVRAACVGEAYDFPASTSAPTPIIIIIAFATAKSIPTRVWRSVRYSDWVG